DVLLGRHPAIRDEKIDPTEYDMVVLGASVWIKRLSSPMRTYIGKHKAQFKNIAFFCTYGGQGAENAARQCATLAAKPLKATLAITDNEIEQATYWPKLDEFIQQIRQTVSNP
ncbi:MAG: flavodoxin family protein, partial [Candidatus Saccharimonadales bacterium]